MNTTLTELQNSVAERLDRIEERLPAIPARVLHLQRVIARTTLQRAEAFWAGVTGPATKMFGTTRTAANTVTGQARAAGEDVMENARRGVNDVVKEVKATASEVADAVTTGTKQVAKRTSQAGRRVGKAATTGAKTVTGQARAQSKRVAATAETTVRTSVNKAIDQVEGRQSGVAYEKRSKAELMELARQRDIDGRSAMSKRQLIAALRK